MTPLVKSHPECIGERLMLSSRRWCFLCDDSSVTICILLIFHLPFWASTCWYHLPVSPASASASSRDPIGFFEQSKYLEQPDVGD